MGSEKPKRRLPKQERSRIRYNHILDTAAAMFEQDGIDNVSTNHIATEAEVSIGSLYQFFPNKEAIIEALIERYVEGIDAVLPEQIDTSIPMDEMTRLVLERFMRFEAEKSGFAAILLSSDTGLAWDANRQMHKAIVTGVERVLAAYYPDISAEKRLVCAQVTVAMVKGMMMLSDTFDMKQLIEHMQIAVRAYQRNILESQ